MTIPHCVGEGGSVRPPPPPPPKLPDQVGNFHCMVLLHHPKGFSVLCTDKILLIVTVLIISIIFLALSGYLFYATQSYINALSLDRPKAISSVPKITDNAITHVDTHVKSNTVVWANNSADGHSATAIKSSLINDTSNIKIIQTGFYGPMGGIVIDWISENIYWSQQHLKRIEVSRFDGRFRRTVVESKRAIRIRSLSINPRTR